MLTDEMLQSICHLNITFEPDLTPDSVGGVILIAIALVLNKISKLKWKKKMILFSTSPLRIYLFHQKNFTILRVT
jgi:hypothetical protein